MGGTTTLNAAVVAVGKTEILKQSRLGPATNSSKYLDTEGKIIEHIHIFKIHQVLNIHDMDLKNPLINQQSAKMDDTTTLNAAVVAQWWGKLRFSGKVDWA